MEFHQTKTKNMPTSIHAPIVILNFQKTLPLICIFHTLTINNFTERLIILFGSWLTGGSVKEDTYLASVEAKPVFRVVFYLAVWW